MEEVRLWAKEGFHITKLSEVTGVNRSLYYYHNGMEEAAVAKEKRGRPIPGYSKTNRGEIIPDEQIEEFLMEAIEGDGETYGVKNLTQFLKDHHDLQINHKKVARLCRKLGILLPQRMGNPKYPKRFVRNRLVTAPNQLWQLDIKYGAISGSRRFFFVACAIDVFDRAIVGYYRGPRCTAKDITGMLNEAIIRRGLQALEQTDDHCIVIRTDNGPQFVSNLFGEFCERNKVFHERIPPRSPNYNAYIESFFSILERDLFRRYDFELFDEAYYEIDEFMKFYNHRRYHGSLGRMSPVNFYEKYKDIGFPEEMALSL
ncbi:IS3 family transposase [Bacillus haimaensis]|uniref:IS3 family transposase n=1 Tax=Bacillus haimaensis TaxID=3160967 RepID=UPI003AA9177A